MKIPTAGHFLQDDEPQIVLQKIKAFLDEDCAGLAAGGPQASASGAA